MCWLRSSPERVVSQGRIYLSTLRVAGYPHGLGTFRWITGHVWEFKKMKVANSTVQFLFPYHFNVATNVCCEARQTSKVAIRDSSATVLLRNLWLAAHYGQQSGTRNALSKQLFKRHSSSWFFQAHNYMYGYR